MKKTTTLFTLSFILAFNLLPALSFAQAAGSLDLSFDTDGIVTTAVGTSEDQANGIAIQPDGKIVVAGARYAGFDLDYVVVRYNSDGTLDNNFGTSGIAITEFTGNDDIAKAVALQDDGKIVVAGYSHDGNYYTFGVARYNSDGTPDNTFDTDGKVNTQVGSYAALGTTITIQDDGKIIVAGYAESNGLNATDFAVVRYNSDGSLDNTFDTDGKVMTDMGSIFDYSYSVAVQNDGKILVTGESRTNPGDIDFATARYNSDGSLDNTFDTDGKLITAIGSLNDQSFSVILQDDQQILIGGFSYLTPNGRLIIIRLNTDGTLDNTFDTDGIVATTFGGNFAATYSLVLQPDDKILAAGYGVMTNEDFALLRYNSDGSLDNSFDTDGIVTTAIGSGTDMGYSMTLQTDGKVVVAGTSHNGNDIDIALARYHNDLPIGISNASEATELEIYPNPSAGKITIAQNSMEYTNLQVTNLLGETIMSHSLGTTTTFDLPKGIYFVNVYGKGKNETKKLVVR